MAFQKEFWIVATQAFITSLSFSSYDCKTLLCVKATIMTKFQICTRR